MTRLLALLLAAPSLALAQGIDLSGGGPVDVTASDGIEWRQTEQVIVARRDARAIRGEVTVDADRLMARYRPAGGAGNAQAGGAGNAQAGGAGTAPAGGAARPAGQPPALGENPAGGSSEIWRLEAEGHVVIHTPTDTARGDRAVYDMDQAVLVLTGRELSLTTPTQVLTSRDSLEYWSQRRMAVARGNAVAVDSQEGRQIGADTLVSYLLPEDAPAAPAPVRPATANGRAAAPAPGAGKVDRVEAFGHVEIRTPTEVVRGDRGVYSPATGMARLLGNVRITRGDNQVNGREAIVNLRTGVARLVSAADRGERVRGLIVPQQEKPAAGQAPAAQAPTPQSPTSQAAPQQGRRP
jgi:lipopolysaccharide export system protein LptA